MRLSEFKGSYYLFDPNGFGRIFVYVDFGNVRPWAKYLWEEENKYKISVEIDIQKLSELCSAVNPIKKFFYYGHYAKNEGYPEDHKNNDLYRRSIFRIDKARKSGFKTRTKEIKMIPRHDESGNYLGQLPKCNFDVEITMDIIRNVSLFDTVVLFSGDSDFGQLLEYVKSKGKRVVIVSLRRGMSTELQKVQDVFVPAEKLKNLLRYDNKNNTPPNRTEV